MKMAVISPHPDDETLGAGGTLLRYKAEGCKIYWINVTDARAEYGWDSKFVEQRRKQIQSVRDFYGFDGFYNLELPPAKLDTLEQGEIIGRINQCFREIEPDWVILPDYNDAHSDHFVVYKCAMACTKIFRHPYIKRVLSMEIISETDFGGPEHPFEPNMFIDITEYMDKKREALTIYETELGQRPFPRNAETLAALATLRGAAAGTMWAEAFRMIKMIE